jgi:hypothetical protein
MVGDNEPVLVQRIAGWYIRFYNRLIFESACPTAFPFKIGLVRPSCEVLQIE